jgi:hypothetical protein
MELLEEADRGWESPDQWDLKWDFVLGAPSMLCIGRDKVNATSAGVTWKSRVRARIATIHNSGEVPCHFPTSMNRFAFFAKA